MSTQRIEPEDFQAVARQATDAVVSVFTQHAVQTAMSAAIDALVEVFRVAEIEKQLRVISDSQRVIDDAREIIARLEGPTGGGAR